MSARRQRGRRIMRFPGRFFGYFLETRYGAAEGVLGLVAVMLVVWMLWPEEQGSQLDQSASWQESVDAVERRRAALNAGEDASDRLGTGTTNEEATAPIPERAAETAPSAEPQARRIATPSELADRLDRFGRRPGDLAVNQSFKPAPRRPSAAEESGIGAEPLLQAEIAVGEESGEESARATPSESERIDVARAVDDLREESLGSDAHGSAEAETTAATSAPDEVGLASDLLEFEPLPEIDLSDLDTLVPSEIKDLETAALVPDDVPDDPTDLPEDAAIAPSQDAAIAPFVVEPDPSAPATDVWERPRDDAPTWLKNAVASSVVAERPIIAIVIDDLGLNRRNTAALNELPAPLTLAFLPYAGRIQAQTEAAKAAGHELMLHLPMEPVGSDWPGPDALTTAIDQVEFAARLEKNLDRFEGFVGINNHMGSRLTADSSRMEVVMRELRERDVLFLDSKTSARSVASDIAGRAGVPNTSRDIFLDHVIDPDAIKRQLALAERVARRNGSAVAIGHPHKATIQALHEWLPTLEARGFALAPISAVVARRACSDGVLIAADTCGRYLQARTRVEPALAAKGG